MKRKHFLLFSLILEVVFLASCAKDIEQNPNQSDEPKELEQTAYVITAEQAVAEVESLIGILDETPTRSGSQRKIASVEPVGGFATTRTDGAEETPLYYVVNFENGEGFALASGDARTTPVFCITESGNLDASTLDMTNYEEHPGLKIMFSRYDTEYRATVGLPLYNYETGEWVEKGAAGYPVFTGSISDIATIRPLWITTSSAGEVIHANWGQWAPYNDYISIDWPTGCVATAVAIVMAHWEQPQSYNGQPFDWDEMKSTLTHFNLDGHELVDPVDIHHMIATLMEALGFKHNLDMNYDPDGSGANLKNVYRTFKNFGYTDGGVYRNGNHKEYGYDFEKIVEQLVAGRPVIAEGWTETWWGDIWTKSYGHAWVIDRVITQRLTGVALPAPTRRLAHCNWGWDGDCNGYFTPNVWDTANAIINDPSNSSSISDFYDERLGMVIGMDWDGY